MEFNIMTFWNFDCVMGFGLLLFDFDREDCKTFSLIGISFEKEERILAIDIFWKEFEFKL